VVPYQQRLFSPKNSVVFMSNHLQRPSSTKFLNFLNPDP